MGCCPVIPFTKRKWYLSLGGVSLPGAIDSFRVESRPEVGRLTAWTQCTLLTDTRLNHGIRGF